MTKAEAALREFARANRLRVTVCNHYSANLGEPALLQARLSLRGRRVTLRAGVSLLQLELRGLDLEFGFAINRPDQISLFNRAAPALQGFTPWPVFVSGSADSRPIRDWLEADEHRGLIEGFAFTRRESVHVHGNSVDAVVEATRVFHEVAERIISLAESVPPAQVAKAINCENELPEDLRHLANLFASWAISDDDERQARVARSRKAQRAQLRRVVEPLLSRIDEYLDSLAEPLPICALRLGYLAELVAEIRVREV